jgi:hypothetical protein
MPWVVESYGAFERLLLDPHDAAAQVMLDAIRNRFDDATEGFGGLVAQEAERSAHLLATIARLKRQTADADDQVDELRRLASVAEATSCEALVRRIQELESSLRYSQAIEAMFRSAIDSKS